MVHLSLSSLRSLWFNLVFEVFLRVDLFLKLMGVAKTRMAAKRLCDTGKVRLLGKALKPSHELSVGETLEVFLPFNQIRLEVLGVPKTKSVAKSDRPLFARVELSQES